MRYAVISDIHANLQALTAVLECIDDVGVDEIVCLGDVVGYNANPNECIDLIRERDIPTICGNHDAVACEISDPWGFNPIALAAALWTREHILPENAAWLRELTDMLLLDDFMAVHGAPASRDMYMFGWEDVLPQIPILEDADRSLCFFGHTHCPGIFSEDGVYSVDNDSKFGLGKDKTFFINPGSVGQPRDGDHRAAFGLMDVARNEYELVRVPYNIKQAAESIIHAGLPHFLADRLSLGR